MTLVSMEDIYGFLAPINDLLNPVYNASHMCLIVKMLLKVENTLLRSHRQRETTGIKKLYNSFFVLF